MDPQDLAVATVVGLAVAYLVRSLWPRRRKTIGCAACPHNPAPRNDYV